MGEHLRHKEKTTDRNRYFLPFCLLLTARSASGLSHTPFTGAHMGSNPIRATKYGDCSSIG